MNRINSCNTGVTEAIVPRTRSSMYGKQKNAYRCMQHTYQGRHQNDSSSSPVDLRQIASNKFHVLKQMGLLACADTGFMKSSVWLQDSQSVIPQRTPKQEIEKQTTIKQTNKQTYKNQVLIRQSKCTLPSNKRVFLQNRKQVHHVARSSLPLVTN